MGQRIESRILQSIATMKSVPKLQTNLLHDPVAEFVPESDPDGDQVTELPGGLNRTIMPSPRGGFYANQGDMNWAMKQIEGALRTRPQRDDLVARNIIQIGEFCGAKMLPL